ncbi:unnamed protein product [Ilex paraguariensis]|uniref:Uncharacterized protein n=1 Tax=Ilex paraguariensis TaxID=185542 RepID=A0ABC8U9I7_9AQUA
MVGNRFGILIGLTMLHLLDEISVHLIGIKNKEDALFVVFLHNCNILDEMGNRINELEQSINDLRSEMGAEGGSPSPLAPSKKPDEVKPGEVHTYLFWFPNVVGKIELAYYMGLVCARDIYEVKILF